MNPGKIRVLIVDDSAMVRKVVAEALAHDPAIEVVGTAMDPYFARDKILELKPDVLTLDIEMPRMDGLTFLKIIMEQRPMPVIIISSLTQAGSEKAMEALQAGAVDVLGKPAGAYSFGELGPQLIAKIKAAATARLRKRRTDIMPIPAPPRAVAEPSPPPPPPAPAPAPVPFAPAAPAAIANRPSPAAPAPFSPPAIIRPRGPLARQVILLGASTGGTEALREVLVALPADMPGIAIVQHIPAMFSRAFAERLNTLCALEVREAKDGDRLERGLALIAPGNFHMLLQWRDDHYCVRVTTGPTVWYQRPAVDLLFKSGADCAGPNAIAGVLTGMGKDGAEGLLKLRQQGAATFSQDEETSVVFGMPRVAWELGGSQYQLPLEKVADHLVAVAHARNEAPSLTHGCA